MKKTISLIACLCFTAILHEVNAQDRFAWLTLGGNSGDLGIYPSFSFGYKTGMFALEVGGTAYFGGIESYPIPHSNFTPKGESNTGSLGVDGLYFLEIEKIERLEIFGGIGIYADQISNIADSNVSNRRYTQETNYKLSPALSAGINLKVPNKEDSLTPLRKHFHSIGVGYHTVRGINIMFMLSF